MHRYNIFAYYLSRYQGLNQKVGFENTQKGKKQGINFGEER